MEELVEHEVLIFDSHRLPSVFDDLNENEFSNVNAAIEDRVSFYDHENED
jgi:hypothetical protein